MKLILDITVGSIIIAIGMVVIYGTINKWAMLVDPPEKTSIFYS